MRNHGQFHRSLVIAGTGLLILGMSCAMGGANSAQALPPGGPGSDTPGTWANVSPRQLYPCQTLNYSVGGFPAGQTVSVKIDDGVGYGDTNIQGTGVVARQVINAQGVANGSFELPCGIASGNHWLRFLASAPAPNSNDGSTIGFTHRTGSEFTVITRDSGSQGGDSSFADNSTKNKINRDYESRIDADGGSNTEGDRGRQQGANQGQNSAENGGEQVTGEGGTLGIDPKFAIPSNTPEPPVSTPDQLPADRKGSLQLTQAGGAANFSFNKEMSGQWVFIYAYSDPIKLGWYRVDNDGHVNNIDVSVLEPGEHYFAVLDRDGKLIAWSPLKIDAHEPPPSASSPANQESGNSIHAENESHIPIVGIIISLIVLVSAATAAWILLSKRRRYEGNANSDGTTVSGLDGNSPDSQEK